MAIEALKEETKQFHSTYTRWVEVTALGRVERGGSGKMSEGSCHLKWALKNEVRFALAGLEELSGGENMQAKTGDGKVQDQEG